MCNVYISKSAVEYCLLAVDRTLLSATPMQLNVCHLGAFVGLG